jgi:hypothetical protein
VQEDIPAEEAMNPASQVAQGAVPPSEALLTTQATHEVSEVLLHDDVICVPAPHTEQAKHEACPSRGWTVSPSTQEVHVIVAPVLYVPAGQISAAV